jgi:AGZA family xanthine/uracil permease-like MFS transporter
MPLRIPGGAWAVGLGTLLAWGATLLPDVSSPVSGAALASAFDQLGFYPPIPVVGDLFAGLSHPLMQQFLVPVVIPMGLFNVLGSLQNLESAEAAGDAYPSAPCMAMNGIGSIAAAAFGSCFPTTIYIGHPGWKALGARAGYSMLNGAFFGVVALFGFSHVISALIPIEAGMAIVLWIGIVITAQAFSATPRKHAPAVALGLFPAIAGWGVLVLTQTLGAAGIVAKDPTLADRALSQASAFAMVGMHLPGLVALSQGFMLTCLVWSAAAATLIDRRFDTAARFMLLGAVLAYFGFMHAGTLTPSGGQYDLRPGAGTPWAIGYALSALFFWLTGLWAKRSGQAAA